MVKDYHQERPFRPEKVFIDADSIAYKAAGCAEPREDENGNLVVVDNPRAFVQKIVDEEMTNIIHRCGTTNLESYIEAAEKNIFRDELAVTREYKGNRKGKPKPVYLATAKQHLIKQWNAEVTSRYESEDMVISRATAFGPERCIIAAIDKDLHNHAFTFYDYFKDMFLVVSKTDARKNLWQQVVRGDPADNIPGVAGIGAKKAAHIQTIIDAVEMYKSKGETYEYFIEQFNLIYIRPHLTDKVLYPLTKEEWDEI